MAKGNQRGELLKQSGSHVAFKEAFLVGTDTPGPHHLYQMPVLPPSTLLTTEIRHARRGHLVLSFLVHFYIHSQPAPSPEPRSTLFSWRSYLNWGKMPADDLQDIQDEADERAGRYASTVPASLAAPWVRLSQQLGLPPVLTYATTVLWNWTYIDPSKGLVPG